MGVLMYTEKVFIGYDKDFKEHLLYKLDDIFYKDIITKVIYENDDLQNDLLIPFNTLKSDKDMFTRTIKKIYTTDREQSLDLSKLYVGSVKQVIATDEYYYGNSVQTYSKKVVSSSQNLYVGLMQRLERGRYLDIIYNRQLYGYDTLAEAKYYDRNKMFGQVFVSLLSLSLSQLHEFKDYGMYASKKDVIENFQRLLKERGSIYG